MKKLAALILYFVCIWSDLIPKAYPVSPESQAKNAASVQRVSTPQKKQPPRRQSRRHNRRSRRGAHARRQNPQDPFSNEAIAFSSMYSHILGDKLTLERDGSYCWTERNLQNFNELILSWNACRPRKGYFLFRVSVLHAGGWSPLQKIAEWGHKVQRTFGYEGKHRVHTKHVRVELQGSAMATGFKVQIVPEGGAHLKDLHALFVSASNIEKYHKTLFGNDLPSVIVPKVPAFTQWTGTHPRCKDFCSPTSTSMIVRYFNRRYADAETPKKWGHSELLAFADGVHDHSLDIYGNWIMNIAQAYEETGCKVFYRVQRLNNFAELHHYLMQKIPVAVSIRGSLRGCAWPYNNGHFVVVIGWNKEKQMVRCIDPAFKNLRQTARWYHLSDFVRAWGKSRNLSYISLPKPHHDDSLTTQE